MIVQGFLFLNSAKKVWDALMEIYREDPILAKVHLLQQEIAKIKKGYRSFHLYLSNLNLMWKGLAQHRPFHQIWKY